MDRIPISNSYLVGNEMRYIQDCIETNWISSLGEYVRRFEEEFAQYLGIRYSLTCSNGTAALHLALLALDISPGDEVIVPSFTFIASINSILYCGAIPVFVDVEPDTWCLNPEDVRKKITEKTKAIMAVHLYGNPARMDELMDIAKNNGLYIIEDCAESLGATFDGHQLGSLGDIAAHSFYGNKIITTGEGGMVSTEKESLHNKLVQLRDHGMSPAKRYFHEKIGYNYRLTNLQAAIGLAQLENISDVISKRSAIFGKYNEMLQQVHDIQLPFPGDKRRHPVNWLYTFSLKQGNREELISYLRNKGIDTRPVFHPGHQMPYLNDPVHLPVTEDIANMGISIPTYPALTDTQILYIGESIMNFFKQ